MMQSESAVKPYGRRRTSLNPRAKYNRGEYRRKYYVQYRYGTPWDTYQEWIEKGCCICGDTNPRQWHIDHDNSCCPNSENPSKLCGKCTRGLLCHTCNTLIGHARENLSILKSAIAYLEDWNARK